MYMFLIFSIKVIIIYNNNNNNNNNNNKFLAVLSYIQFNESKQNTFYTSWVQKDMLSMKKVDRG